MTLVAFPEFSIHKEDIKKIVPGKNKKGTYIYCTSEGVLNKEFTWTDYSRVAGWLADDTCFLQKKAEPLSSDEKKTACNYSEVIVTGSNGLAKDIQYSPPVHDSRTKENREKAYENLDVDLSNAVVAVLASSPGHGKNRYAIVGSNLPDKLKEKYFDSHKHAAGVRLNFIGKYPDLSVIDLWEDSPTGKFVAPVIIPPRSLTQQYVVVGSNVPEYLRGVVFEDYGEAAQKIGGVKESHPDLRVVRKLD